MAQDRVLKRRVRSVKNAKQITKALEVVAASRMRKVVGLVADSRSYGELAASIMARISPNPETKNHPYFAGVAGKPTLYVIFTSDRGQAGAFNSNIFNLALKLFAGETGRPQVVVFGRKGARFFARLSGIDLRGAYEDIADSPDVNVFSPVMAMLETEMSAGEIGRVVIVYTQFNSSLSQQTIYFQLLPVGLTDADGEANPNTVYEFEPEVSDVLEEAIRLYAEAKLMQSRIESAASEHAMRMVAMGNANRNASDLIDSLTLEINASRQAAITQEIAEIAGGVAALTT